MSICSQDIGINQRARGLVTIGKNDVLQSQARSCRYESIYNFGEKRSICSQDIEGKRNFGVNQGQ